MRGSKAHADSFLLLLNASVKYFLNMSYSYHHHFYYVVIVAIVRRFSLLPEYGCNNTRQPRDGARSF